MPRKCSSNGNFSRPFPTVVSNGKAETENQRAQIECRQIRDEWKRADGETNRQTRQTQKATNIKPIEYIRERETSIPFRSDE
jgi:hypothetical protein